MYDGSSATPEAAMMAVRLTGRDKIITARSLHPEYREVLATYLQHQAFPAETVGFDAKTGRMDFAELEEKLDEETAAVILQSPNFFGVIEDVKEAARLAHAKGAKLVVMFTEAVALGLLEPPADADIVAGELQSFAHPPSYGGPYCGVLATRREYIRQIPGRLAGQTVDADGNRAFCLTLSTREQHIRRAKATSNICTNTALCALATCIHLSTLGRGGIRELALQNLAKASYARDRLAAIDGVEPVFDGPIFNEFAVRLPLPAGDAVDACAARGVIPGVPLGRFDARRGNELLVCATEIHRREDIDLLASTLAEVCS
jgi:glycine dehydrogenase subunit 1